MTRGFNAALAISLAILVGGAEAQAAPAFLNADFSSPSTTASFAYSQPITDWVDASGAGSASGISAAVPADLWDNGVAPDGETQVAFLQNETAALQQTVGGFIVGDKYQIQVIADARAATGPAGLSIGVNGIEYGAEVLLTNPVVAVDTYGVYRTPWVTYSSAVFTATATSNVIQLQNLGIPGGSGFGDVTIDLGRATIVEVASVPEPSAWAMLISGFGLVGLLLRQRRLAIVQG